MITSDLKILEALAEGLDPHTDELLPDGHVLNRSDVVRALMRTTTTLQALHNGTSKRNPPNAGLPWTEAEEQNLAKGFEEGLPMTRLASIHGRTTGAIRSRLLRLGLINIDDGSTGGHEIVTDLVGD